MCAFIWLQFDDYFFGEGSLFSKFLLLYWGIFFEKTSNWMGGGEDLEGLREGEI